MPTQSTTFFALRCCRSTCSIMSFLSEYIFLNCYPGWSLKPNQNNPTNHTAPQTTSESVCKIISLSLSADEREAPGSSSPRHAVLCSTTPPQNTHPTPTSAPSSHRACSMAVTTVAPHPQLPPTRLATGTWQPSTVPDWTEVCGKGLNSSYFISRCTIAKVGDLTLKFIGRKDPCCYSHSPFWSSSPQDKSGKGSENVKGESCDLLVWNRLGVCMTNKTGLQKEYRATGS